MSQLHITQACFIQPVLDSLKGTANYRQLLQKSGLDKFTLDNPESYLPSIAAYRFLHNLSQQEGIHDLASCFAEKFNLLGLAQWGELAAHCSNLLAAVQFAEKYDQVLMSQERMGFQVSGDRCIFWSKFMDEPVPGREQLDYINLSGTLNSFRLVAGPDWSPMEIHLQSDTEPELDHLLPPGCSTRVLLGQRATAIVFPTSLLFLPMLGQDSSNSQLSMVDNMDVGLTKKIERLIDACQPGYVPDLVRLSDMIDMSPRTLQRRLSEEGGSLSDLIDRWRFEKSIHYLVHTQLKINDVSELLGYANASNFERAFRRWTQTTPRKFREQH